ncbi:Hsp70 family protein [Mycolicibacterium sediminis]|uniref:Molecular chaperone n=1 Tax=Mycolicibacterium sediminis TaxID=1286180 RepID=A0A7I7QWF2_9MYCO|nr:Hsp70 family protein [Mycolicibacterium sediminis]BBY30644.1 molecular chaperone [Mycolicibacterium sediminis]
MTDGRGLSVGAGFLTAVSVGRAAVRRTAVLTSYGHRPSEVGVPSENPRLVERGLVLTDFVDRVGDPVALVASDGSSHRAEVVLADALRAMLLALGPSGAPVGIAYPAHWRPTAVEALRGAVSAVPEFRAPVQLIPDARAALVAVRQDPGVPTRGVIALCDLGGTGTGITLVDAAADFTPIAPTTRHLDLSGDLVDQALLRHVIAELSSAPDLTGTSAIGSLARLRAECRSARERLSANAVTSLPGPGGEIRLTRPELDETMRGPLAGFAAELGDVLARNGVRGADLAAVVTVGGLARTPLVTTTLSEHFRVPIVVARHPELSAAIGAGTSAARATVVDGPTSVAPAAAVVAAASAPTGLAPAAAAAPTVGGSAPALAWSEADDDIPDVIPGPDYDPEAEAGDARPQVAFAEPEPVERRPVPWHRSPVVAMAAGLAVVLAVIAVALVVVLGDDDESTAPTETTVPATSSAPGNEPSQPAPAPEPAPGTVEAPAPAPPAIVTEQAPPPPVPTQAPPPSTEAPPPPPATTEAPPPPATTTDAPPPSSSTRPPVIPTLPYQTIPGLPFVPSPFQPQQP